jgi:pimeloyl-ACP methyl ester carboxylesterase
MGGEPPDVLTRPALTADTVTIASPPVRRYLPTTGGNVLRALLFAAGVLGLVLGGIAIRATAILSGRMDPDLATTPELETFAIVATGARLGLAIVAGVALVAGATWARRMRRSLAALTDDEPLLEPARRTGRLALGLAAGGLAMVGLASLVLLFPVARDAARFAWLLTAAGALALPIAGGLLIWLVGDIERREALLIHALDPARPAPGERDRRWPIAMMAALAVVAIIPPAANVPYLFSDRVCQSAQLECRWILVQADQLGGDPHGRTALLHYGLRRATQERRGTLVIATGGPGVSGVATADQTIAGLDERLTDTFDVVMFDARGVGDSDYADCPAASSRYQSSLTFDADPTVIDDFVDACIEEAGVDPSRLGDYGSAQIAEDIDTIRQDLGVDRIALYAESYGTAAAQRYAVAHPDRLAALILDGAIDLAQPTDRSWMEASHGFDDVLRRTFETCRSTPACRFDASSVWDDVIRSLEVSPVSASYGDPDGHVRSWPLTAELAREALIDAMYDRVSRMLAIRSLSAAEAGDWVPLARLIYSGSTPLARSTVSDFAYYATSCADRFVDGADTDARGYLDQLKRSPLATSPAGGVYLSSAACHAWPTPPATTAPRSAPDHADFPVILLAATADPITPASHAERIFERYRSITDTYLIETLGGPHVTFGRGASCPDDTVVALLLDGTHPGAQRSTCPGDIAAPFVGFPDSARDDDPIAYRAVSLDLELLAHPDYRAWDGAEPLDIGCRYGGRLEVRTAHEAGETVERIDVDGCAVMRDEPMHGTGIYRGRDEADFDVRSEDAAFTYRIVGSDRYTPMEDHVSAVWRGRLMGREIDGRR